MEGSKADRDPPRPGEKSFGGLEWEAGSKDVVSKEDHQVVVPKWGHRVAGPSLELEAVLPSPVGQAVGPRLHDGVS